ncbi:MAG: ribbon-helix-helix protein, CopG family [Candidatus Sigynarchaeum springense]
MVQINIRIDESLDAIITFLAEERKVSKSVIARDLLDAGKN